MASQWGGMETWQLDVSAESSKIPMPALMWHARRLHSESFWPANIMQRDWRVYYKIGNRIVLIETDYASASGACASRRMLVEDVGNRAVAVWKRSIAWPPATSVTSRP